MIFVILGTQKFQLNRLLKELDILIEKRMIDEEVFAQIGHSDYCPKNYEYVDFLDKDTFEKKVEQSSLVITHSGVGSIISAVRFKRPVIVYPRLCKYKEHVDDHQLEIAQTFEKKNIVMVCKNDLYSLIHDAKMHKFDEYVSSTDSIVKLIEDFLEK